jgi:hypothetical protein
MAASWVTAAAAFAIAAADTLPTGASDISYAHY